MSIYIISGKRTPIGSFLGDLSTISATKLGAMAIKGALDDAGLARKDVDEVYMGHVIQAGCGQSPARQASIFAGLSNTVPCTTINKVCGSGMKSIIQGAQSILSGDNSLVISGGMENMSQAPHLMPQSRLGIKFGQGKLQDSLLLDGLWDVYRDCPMGDCAEECAEKFNISRECQDAYAIDSYKRASYARDNGIFKKEITPVTVKIKKGEVVITDDQGPKQFDENKLKKLKPAFKSQGTLTAGNSSSLNDGAAAILMGGKEYKDKAKYRIISWAGHAKDSTWFTTAPIQAMKKSLNKAGLNLSDIDVFEINEAFSLVPLVTMKELNIDHNKVNIYGGAVSLGHPIGCSGTRIVVTLMSAMENKNARFGLASICIGGGEALSLILERF